MDSRDQYSKQNANFKLDPKKIKKLQEKFQSSQFYPRSAYNKIFQDLAAQELKKHKAEHDRTRLPHQRNTQITLAEDAYALINKMIIKEEEYAEFLYQINGRHSSYKKVQVTKAEFEKVLPQIVKEWPDVEKTLVAIMSEWSEVEDQLIEAEKKADDSNCFYQEAVSRLAEAENKPTTSQKELKALCRDKIAKEKEYYTDLKELNKWKHRIARYQNLDYTALEDKDLTETNLQTSRAVFESNYNRVHDGITDALNAVLHAKKPPVDSKKSEEVIKAEIARAEHYFAGNFKINPTKDDLNFTQEKRRLFAQRIIAKIINQRIQDKFEHKKDLTYAGALLYIQKILILHDEYKDNEEAASGNTYLGKFKDMGSRMYRGIFNVLANTEVSDNHAKSRMYKHPNLTERDQQKCLALFRDLAVHNEELFKRIAYMDGTKQKYIDGKKVGRDIPYWKNILNWSSDHAKRPELNKVAVDYEKNSMKKYGLDKAAIAKYLKKKHTVETTWRPIKDSKNVSDFISKSPEKLTVYERVGKSEWKPSTKKVMESIEAGRVLKIFNTTVASFKNIPRTHTQHTKHIKPTDNKLLKSFNKMEELRKRFEDEEMVRPHDIVSEKLRLNSTTQILNFDRHHLKDNRSRVLAERKYPAQGECQAYADDLYKSSRDATLAKIRLESCIRLLPTLPADLSADKYKDTYIYTKDTSRLCYVRNGRAEEVRIIDRAKFRSTLLQIMGNEEVKYLNDQQANELITKNGGHTSKLFKTYPLGPKAGHVVMDADKIKKAKAFGDMKLAAEVGPVPRPKK